MRSNTRRPKHRRPATLTTTICSRCCWAFRMEQWIHNIQIPFHDIRNDKTQCYLSAYNHLITLDYYVWRLSLLRLVHCTWASQSQSQSQNRSALVLYAPDVHISFSIASFAYEIEGVLNLLRANWSLNGDCLLCSLSGARARGRLCVCVYWNVSLAPEASIHDIYIETLF